MSIGAELGSIFCKHNSKKILKIQWGGSLNAPLGTLVGLPNATARVDSRLKLTFGKLVSKSTHHV